MQEITGHKTGAAQLKYIAELLVVLNSTSGPFCKYPFGNKELTETVKQLESANIIKYDGQYDRWLRVKK